MREELTTAMDHETLSTEEAFARGALDAGVSVVTAYPGSPSSGVVDALLACPRARDLHIEWSTNEKVALEVAIGASLGGRRALVCVKSVGMNVLVDPLMVLNLTGVLGGLVIVLGDDPGAYGSQNDQDTRALAAFAEIPLLEPASPAEARTMLEEAFDLSERFGTVAVIRETRSLAVLRAPVRCATPAQRQPARSLIADWTPFRWVPYPKNAVEMHRRLHDRLSEIEAWTETCEYNLIEEGRSEEGRSEEGRSEGDARQGIVAAGFAYTKLLDVLPADTPLRRLKLATLFPLPARRISEFLGACDEVLVLEETEPFVELGILAAARRQGATSRIFGKLSGHVPREGELFRWQIQQALERFCEAFVPAASFSSEREADERPPRKDFCAGCPYPEILRSLLDVGESLGEDLVLLGDPGCLVKASNLLGAKFAMGSAAAVAQGVERAGGPRRPVAVFGDSAFFHTGIPAIVNAVHQNCPVLMLVLDNSATVTSGRQPNPGSGTDARGNPAPRVSIEALAGACGVPFVRTVGPDDSEESLRETFRAGLEFRGLALIVVRKPCK